MRPYRPTVSLKTSSARSSRPRATCPQPMNSMRSAMPAPSGRARLDAGPPWPTLSARRCGGRGRSRRVGTGPRDDLLRAVDDRAVVEHERRHPRVPRQLLALLAARTVDRVGQQAEAVGAHDLGVVPGLGQGVVGVLAGVAAGPGAGKQAPADVELHRRRVLRAWVV